jgi:hypothetical protein
MVGWPRDTLIGKVAADWAMKMSSGHCSASGNVLPVFHITEQKF